MRMQCLASILVSLSLLLGGCYVDADTPVGDQVMAIDPKEWEGSWLSIGRGDTFRVKVVDAANGVLRATSISEWLGKTKLETTDLYLRRSASFGDYWLLSGKESDSDGNTTKPVYVWLGIAGAGRNTCVFWVPRGAVFRALVQSGVLPGKGSDPRVHLRQLTAEHLKMISEEDSVMRLSMLEDNPTLEPKSPFFFWNQPFVFIRLPGSD
jgi:hypothetical protein